MSTPRERAKLALGTAQLGSRYGIANRTGQPSSAEVSALLAAARAAGIDTIDTAAAYGEAEAVLGRAGTSGFRVVTKLAPDVAPGGVAAAVDGSLARLGRTRLDAVLVHRFTPTAEVLALLAEIAAEPRVDRLGISLYSPAEAAWLIAHDVQLDIVQVPFSPFDQRFGPHFAELEARGVEIHVRSVFLQGLYLLDPGELTGSLEAARPPLERLIALADGAGVALPELLLAFAAGQPSVSRLVVGVETTAQLQANVRALAAAPPPADVLAAVGALALDDEDVLIPSRWRP